MDTHEPQLHRPRATQVVAQTLHFYRRHWRALLPLGLLLLPISLLGAATPALMGATAPLPVKALQLLGLMGTALVMWWACQSLGAALVQAPAFPRAMRRCRDRVGPLCHVGALQLGRAAWVLGKVLLVLTVAIVALVGLPMLLHLPVGVGVAEGTLLLMGMGGLTLMVPMVRLQLEFLVMTQFVITGSAAEVAHQHGLQLCRGNLGWLFGGYVLAMLPGMLVGYGSAIWHYVATGSPQVSVGHPAFYLNMIVGCLLLPFTATFPAMAAQALRQVPVEEVAVSN